MRVYTHTYTPNIGTPKYKRQILTDTKEEIHSNTVVGEFNIPVISPGISLEGMMLKQKLQYFGHLMGRVDSLEKTLMVGGIGGRRRRGQQQMRWLDGTTNSMDMSLNSGSC